MKIFKNYKKLYLTELNNRKLYEERYKEIYEKNIQYQFELEDLRGFYNQEKEAKEELLKQRKKLRAKITKLGGTWEDERK